MLIFTELIINYTMSKIFFLTGVLLFFAVSHPVLSQDTPAGATTSFLPEDKQIAERILAELSPERNQPAGELFLKIGLKFLGTPYVAQTLENGAAENLIINLRELDCTTYAENVLALTRTLKSDEPGFDRFIRELEYIRYRSGKRDGYLSRLHYFSEWISDNQEKKTVRDVAGEIAGISYPNQVNFMSRHPDSYPVLKENPRLIEALKMDETLISGRQAWYIPKDRIAEFGDKLNNGDIIALATPIEGLDVTHVGIVVKKEGRIYMLHASSKEMKVVLTTETLVEYLQKSKSTSGIMVARPI
jgi:hypothetical protein